jgi:SAM-dependent methyltransferase
MKIPFSQLWIEEEGYLAEAVRGLPGHPVIVEIGTAEGGSAFLFSRESRDNKGTVYTYDVSPSAEAYTHLRSADNVTIMAKSSETGAEAWPEDCGRPIDLLFIDGSHTLSNVFSDFNGWIRYLRPGGKLVFHDYDPVERGGASHLGVRVFVDTVRRCLPLKDPCRIGRIFSATIEDPASCTVSSEACFETWKIMGRFIAAILACDFKEWTVIGDLHGQSHVLMDLLSIPRDQWRESLPEEPHAIEPVLIVERPISDNTQAWLHHHLGRGLFLDDLTWGYIILYALSDHRDRLLDITSDRPTLFKWEEYIEMLRHAAPFPTAVPDLFQIPPGRIQDLSALCAREVLRLGFASRLREAMVGHPATMTVRA